MRFAHDRPIRVLFGLISLGSGLCLALSGTSVVSRHPPGEPAPTPGVSAASAAGVTNPAPVAARPPAANVIVRDRVWVSIPGVLPVRGWFSDGFRWREDPLTGKRRFHRGLDIVAPAGAVVRAPADGIVTHAAEAGGYGNMIELQHGVHYRTRFAHLATMLVREGETVRPGQPLGLVGSTGRTKGAHLHYEVLKDGRRINPWPYLGDEKSDPAPATFNALRTVVTARR